MRKIIVFQLFSFLMIPYSLGQAYQDILYNDYFKSSFTKDFIKEQYNKTIIELKGISDETKLQWLTTRYMFEHSILIHQVTDSINDWDFYSYKIHFSNYRMDLYGKCSIDHFEDNKNCGCSINSSYGGENINLEAVYKKLKTNSEEFENGYIAVRNLIDFYIINPYLNRRQPNELTDIWMNVSDTIQLKKLVKLVYYYHTPNHIKINTPDKITFLSRSGKKYKLTIKRKQKKVSLQYCLRKKTNE